jgi:metacaspase-1
VTRKALCVGINDYPVDGSDLNGCVNDALAWADVLSSRFQFARSDIKLLTDSAATKKNILDGIKEMLAGAKAADVLVFTNSSHGTYVADKDGDEERYDEAICPYDIDENLIVDDELRGLFSGVPRGVHATVISDSCFSGTVLRAAVGENVPGLETPDDRRVRFLNPALLGRAVLENPFRALPKRRQKFPESSMTSVLLSGCSDNEYSYDALIDGKYNGAMTYAAIRAINESRDPLTYQQLHTRVRNIVARAGYPQHPQLEGRRDDKRSLLFGASRSE